MGKLDWVLVLSWGMMGATPTALRERAAVK
jgi:hypothetical protein